MTRLRHLPRYQTIRTFVSPDHDRDSRYVEGPVLILVVGEVPYDILNPPQDPKSQVVVKGKPMFISTRELSWKTKSVHL